MKKQWINNNGNYYFDDIPTVTDELEKGIYELNFDQFKLCFFLTKVSDKFELPEKMYDVEDELVERIINTYKKLDKNFGVLLKGLKGTGKTIVAKQVCNTLDLPVILVNKAYNNLGQFINSIDQNIILLFDEFEKTYELNDYRDDDDEDPKSKRGISHLLTLMDGVFTSENKRLFLLTTNKVYLPDALMSRPSRIRYIKEFNDLSFESIIEILNDSVENKDLIPKLADILKELKVITVDIVKSIAEEANLYNTADKEFFSIFNVTKDDDQMDLYEIETSSGEETEVLVFEDFKPKLDQYYPGYNITIRKLGNIGHIEDLSPEDGTFTTVKNDKVRKFILKPKSAVHKNMATYAYLPM